MLSVPALAGFVMVTTMRPDFAPPGTRPANRTSWSVEAAMLNAGCKSIRPCAI